MEKQDDILNLMRDGIFTTDQSGMITFANRQLANMLGYDYPEEVIGKHFSEFVSPEFGAEILDKFKKAVEDISCSEAVEFDVIRKDGVIISVQLKHGPIQENNQIIGWAIWHESNTREHQKGAPRNEEDIKILETLSNGQCEVIELHELWLKKAHRGKGYGKQFFDFFEDFITSKGYNKLVYYTDNASAISICRKRGYKESYYKDLNWHTFYKVVNAQ